MTVFLTSHIGGSVKKEGRRIPAPLIEDNDLVSNLQARWPQRAKVLFISADPQDIGKSESYRSAFAYAFPFHGMAMEAYAICDCRDEHIAARLSDFDVLILSGGHVPTQNSFFQRIGLKERLRDFQGIVIGISAGSMNCAQLVYAHPELAGEAIGPDYRRFLPGLGLTKQMILPHFQNIRNDVLDGLRVIEDIAFPDSCHHTFCALNDGSYILCENGRETVYGEAYLIKDGQLSLLCGNNESVVL